MNKTSRLWLILLTLFLGTSCDINVSENSSFISSIANQTYERDDQNFYILPDTDYKIPVGEDGSSQVFFSDIPSEIPLSNHLRLYADGENIPLYNIKVNSNHVWSPEANGRIDNTVGIIRKKGPVTLVLATNFALKHGITIRPLASNVSSEIDEEKRLIVFTIEKSGQYTIEFRLNRTLHLFVDEYDMYDDVNPDNTIYFGPGIHNHQNDNRINAQNNINISSNQTVFVDYGAIIQGSFVANNASNIRLIGGGIVDGQSFTRNATTGERQIPLDFNFCQYVEIQGLSFLDPAGWTLNVYFCNNVTIDDVKIISSRSNGDGISLQSCQDVNVNRCFVRSWDDSLVVKNYLRWDNRNIQGTTRNIYFDHCLIWTDLAQSMEIGFETIGKVMDNINFTNITILHNYHKPAISIHNGNNADVTNVKYQNIIIEDASMGNGDGTPVLFELSTLFSATWSTNHTTTELGSISTIVFDNIHVLFTNGELEIKIQGCQEERSGFEKTLHEINDVTFSNVYINDEKLTENYKKLVVNEYVHGLNFG